MSAMGLESPPILPNMRTEDITSTRTPPLEMPSLQKVDSLKRKSPLPFRQYISSSDGNDAVFGSGGTEISPIVISPETTAAEFDRQRALHNMDVGVSDHGDVTSCIVPHNGKVPLARDINMSLLKLANKLKQAQKKHDKKAKTMKTYAQITKGQPFSVRITKGYTEVKSLLKSVINSQSSNPSTMTISESDVPNVVESKTGGNLSGQISLLKPIPLKYIDTTQNKDVKTDFRSEKLVDNSASMKQTQEDVQIVPFTMPPRPVDAMQLLTWVKFHIMEGNAFNCPETTGLPLWPVFSATRDGGAKMDTSFLNKYIPDGDPEEEDQPDATASVNQSKSTRSGRQVNAPDRLVEETEETMNTEEKPESKYEPEANEGNSHFSIEPPPELTEDEIKCIEDLAFEYVSKIHVARAARRAIDTTKSVIELARRNVLKAYSSQNKITSFTPIENPIQDTPTSLILSTNPVSSSPKVEFDSNMENSTDSIQSIPITVQPIANPWKMSYQTPSKYSSPSLIAEDGVIPRKYKCPSCKYQTDNRSHLRRHESSVHSGEKIYECYICKIDFARSEKCRNHMFKEHPEIEYDPRLIRKDKTYMNKPVHGLITPELKNKMIKETPTRDGKLQKESGLDLSLKTRDTDMDYSNTIDAEQSFDFHEDSLNDGSLAESEKSIDLSLHQKNDTQLGQNASNSPTRSLLMKALGKISASNSPQDGTSSTSSPVNLSDSATNSPQSRYQCPHCSYVGKDAWHVRRHVQDVHNNRKAYQCKSCSYVTSRKHRLISHMKNHGCFTCLYCDYASPDQDAFVIHFKLCSENQKLGGLTCRFCNHAFFNRKILADHVERTHGTRLFTCDLCYFNTTDEEAHDLHSKSHITGGGSSSSGHLNGGSGSSPGIPIAAAKTSIQQHRTCTICGETFTAEQLYEAHMMTSHKTENVDFEVDGTFVEERDGNYVCLLCSYESSDKDQILAHIEHHKSKWYRCDAPNCSFVAATKKALNNHKASQHLELLQAAPFTKAVPVDTSHIYDKETGGLQGHGSGMWQCHICPDKTLYRYRRSYEKHMAKHQGFVQPSIEVQSHRTLPMLDPDALTCLMCGAQGWADRSQLQAHLLQAHGIDAFDHHDDDSHGSGDQQAHSSAQSPPLHGSSSSSSLAHPPRMSDAHVQMLRQIAANATSPPVHLSGPVAWPEPEAASPPSTHSSQPWQRSDSSEHQLASKSSPSSSSNLYTSASHCGPAGDNNVDADSMKSASGVAVGKSHSPPGGAARDRGYVRVEGGSGLTSPHHQHHEGSRTSAKRAHTPSNIERLASHPGADDSSEEEEWPSEWQSSATKRLKSG